MKMMNDVRPFFGGWTPLRVPWLSVSHRVYRVLVVVALLLARGR